MKGYILSQISHYSSLLPLLVAVFSLRILPRTHIPFVILLLLGAINEFLSMWLIHSRGSNHVNSNIYVLVEYMVLLWFFSQWVGWSVLGERLLMITGVDNLQAAAYTILVIVGLLVWILDNLVLHSLSQNNSLFRIVYSCIIVRLSIRALYFPISFETDTHLRHAGLLLSFTLIMYYTNKAFIESFNLYHLNISPFFYRLLWMALNCFTILANILYTLVILCIRRKNIFFWLYSPGS